MAEPIFCTVVEQKPAFTFKIIPQAEVFLKFFKILKICQVSEMFEHLLSVGAYHWKMLNQY